MAISGPQRLISQLGSRLRQFHLTRSHDAVNPVEEGNKVSSLSEAPEVTKPSVESTQPIEPTQVGENKG